MLSVLGSLVAVVIELNQSQRLSQASAYQTTISEIQEAQRELALSKDIALPSKGVCKKDIISSLYLSSNSYPLRLLHLQTNKNQSA
jgi:hypothetical protein